MMKSNIKASVSAAVIGSYTGEVLDSNITNKNGLDITSEVMKNVFESDDYKEGIEHGWFIGYLGHPEDPDCQDFKNGCIVMTDGYIDDDGKCYGTFNLVDTPVGQIVKTYIDAGVEFGISIRGAGDIVANSVDPDTFVFRGFDLVAFPAYPDSIPKFTQIAASSSATDRHRYQSICAATMDCLDSITSASAIDVLKSQFAPQSDVYKALELRREQLCNTSSSTSVDAERISAMTDLYIGAEQRIAVLASENEKLKIQMAKMQSAHRRKIDSIERITANQTSAALDQIDRLESERSRIQASLHSTKQALTAAKNNNLIYRRKAESAEADSEHKAQTIADLNSKLRETVTASQIVQASASNRDAEIESIQKQLTACRRQLEAYQDAYAQIYASALGVNPESINLSESTSVSELRRVIESATNTVNIAVAPSIEYLEVDETDSDDLITL